ncbi:MAG TPA: hypothetical protein VFK33_02035 [Bacillales bacterium]|nr:hypothetical protein [Bacillales bacterium]
MSIFKEAVKGFFIAILITFMLTLAVYIGYLFLSPMAGIAVWLFLEVYLIIALVVRVIGFFRRKKSVRTRVRVISLTVLLSASFTLIMFFNALVPEVYGKISSPSPVQKLVAYRKLSGVIWPKKADLTKFAKEKRGPFTFYENGKINPSVVQQALDGIHQAQKDGKTLFGKLPNQSTKIILNSDRAQFLSKENTFQKNFTAGIRELVKAIDEGHPYAGYLAFVQKSGLPGALNKKDLIQIALQKYPKGDPSEKQKLVSYEEGLK